MQCNLNKEQLREEQDSKANPKLEYRVIKNESLKKIKYDHYLFYFKNLGKHEPFTFKKLTIEFTGKINLEFSEIEDSDDLFLYQDGENKIKIPGSNFALPPLGEKTISIFVLAKAQIKAVKIESINAPEVNQSEKLEESDADETWAAGGKK